METLAEERVALPLAQRIPSTDWDVLGWVTYPYLVHPSRTGTPPATAGSFSALSRHSANHLGIHSSGILQLFAIRER
jgi:hypothetical protein